MSPSYYQLKMDLLNRIYRKNGGPVLENPRSTKNALIQWIEELFWSKRS